MRPGEYSGDSRSTLACTLDVGRESATDHRTYAGISVRSTDVGIDAHPTYAGTGNCRRSYRKVS